MPPPPNRSRSVAWKPLVVCPQPDFFRRIQTVLAGLAVELPCMMAEYPHAGTIAAVLESTGCNICFLDAATSSEHAQSLISELAPLVPVVALHPRDDADLILRCLRSGASEFIAEPAADAVREVLERLTRARFDAVHHAAGSVYCVVPGKPGCGGSTLALHLAIQLRASGTKPVLLVDGDHLTASIAFMLKLKPEFHLEDVRDDWERMDDDLWSRLTVPAFGVDILCSPEDPTIRTVVSRQFAGELCAFWRERYQAVVLDLPNVSAASDCGFAALADLILLVTTNELGALHATGRSLRYLDAGTCDRAKLRLILNRYAPAAGLNRADVKTVWDLEPFAMLADDSDAIQPALLEGEPAPPHSRYRASVQALCRQLTHTTASETKKPSWLRSLLHRK
jgi:pilus assembly protein CpaE